MRELRNCEQCSKTFEYRPGYGCGRFCSISCANHGKSTKVSRHHDLIVQLFDEGNTYEEIGRAIGAGGKSVKAYMVRKGLPLRSRSEAMTLTRAKHPSQFQIHPVSGSDHPSWRTGRIDIHGYVGIWKRDHPRADNKGYVFEHILVWEQVHNKPLPKGWIVHHLNGIKNDNRPCNLAGMPSHKHFYVLAKKAQRIRGLEAEVKLLEKAFETSQMIFRIEEN